MSKAEEIEENQSVGEMVKLPRKRNNLRRIEENYKLDGLDAKICEIIYEHPIVSYKELAALTGANISQIKFRLTKPVVRKRIADMHMSKADLIERAKLLGVRKLTRLLNSQDEWIALQACKVLLHGELAAPSVKISSAPAEGITYEVQIGSEGQVFQTITKQATRPAEDATDKKFPDVIDVVHSIVNHNRE